MALSSIQFHPYAQDFCLQCHSTDYRLAPEGDKPTLAEAIYDLECAACHQSHGSQNVSQLRLPPTLLCAECHTMGDAAPGAKPHHSQAEMLHGVGGFALDGAPLDGPYTPHSSYIPDECVTCHVLRESYGGPDQPANSGHTFESNMRACEPCHTEAEATLLVSITRDEIEARLSAIARYLDPDDPLYVDPSTLNPEELEQYNIAKFDYELVGADSSGGSHNGDYARVLLTEAESFFGIMR